MSPPASRAPINNAARPQRIVCLSAEAAEICQRLGAWERIVGVSAYFNQAHNEPRPVISGFSGGSVEKIVALEPDLVLTFSDVQAGLAAALIRAGCTVLATNQRTLAEIADMICLLGRVIGCAEKAESLSADFSQALAALRFEPARRPRIYFEEWPEPMISGIAWIGELIELCGGRDLFAQRRGKAAVDRTVRSEEIIAAAPEIIIASWCGKSVDFAALRQREGWTQIPAIQNGALFEIASSAILQPGPALLEGARQLAEIIKNWEKTQP